MTFLSDNTELSRKEIAVSRLNIETIAEAHAAGVITLIGAVDITKPVVEPTQPVAQPEKLETSSPTGEEVISPFSAAVDNNILGEVSNDKTQPIVGGQSIISQPLTPQSSTTLDAGPVVQTQSVAEGQGFAPQSVTPQVPTAPVVEATPQAISGESVEQITQPSLDATKKTPETNIFDNPNQTAINAESVIGSVQPQSVTPAINPELTVINQQYAAPIQTQPEVKEEVKVSPAVVASDNQAVAAAVPGSNINKTGIDFSSLEPHLFPNDIVSGIIIRRNETIYDLSYRTGAPVEAIAKLNNIIDPNLIPGQFLLLPAGLQDVYRYELEEFRRYSDIVINRLYSGEVKDQPEAVLNNIGEGFGMKN